MSPILLSPYFLLNHAWSGFLLNLLLSLAQVLDGAPVQSPLLVHTSLGEAHHATSTQDIIAGFGSWLSHLKRKTKNATWRWSEHTCHWLTDMKLADWQLAMTDCQTCNLQVHNWLAHWQLAIRCLIFPFDLTSAYVDKPKAKLMQDVKSMSTDAIEPWHPKINYFLTSVKFNITDMLIWRIFFRV